MQVFNASPSILFYMELTHEKHTMTVGESRIAYERISPPDVRFDIPLLFLHDSLGCISVWKEFPATFAREAGVNVVIYDREGYGLSSAFGNGVRDINYLEEQADVLPEILDRLQIGRCLLFGHSDGGSIALIAAAKYPERIAGIITEGAHVFVEDVTLAGIREAFAAYRNGGLRTRLLRHHGDKTEAVVHAWVDTWLSGSFRNWNIRHFLHRIHCPALIIQGYDDEYGSPAQVEAICDGIGPTAQSLLIPGTGHSPHREAAEATLTACLLFMRQLRTSGQC